MPSLLLIPASGTIVAPISLASSKEAFQNRSKTLVSLAELHIIPYHRVGTPLLSQRMMISETRQIAPIQFPK